MTARQRQAMEDRLDREAVADLRKRASTRAANKRERAARYQRHKRQAAAELRRWFATLTPAQQRALRAAWTAYQTRQP